MENTMSSKFRVAAMLGVLMGAAPLAQAANASLSFENATDSPVRVEIYYSDVNLPGNPQKTLESSEEGDDWEGRWSRIQVQHQRQQLSRQES